MRYDAAGAVVHRTNKAHPYARFYYRPKSPTQFYNECLGWDDSLTMWNKSYYLQACNLHLPKCPMPVFFEFDIREIIAKCLINAIIVAETFKQTLRRYIR